MKRYAISLMLGLILLGACGKKSENSAPANADSTLVMVTQEQFDAMGMALGAPQEVTFRETVKVSGNVISSVNGQAQITSRVAGTIRNISREIGDYAPAGSVLCTIESNDFIALQEEFNTIGNNYRMAKANYERLRALYRDSISSKKDFQTAESAYRSLSAQYEGLKQRLNLLRANPSEIEGGKIYSLLPIRAPIGGYITQLNCMNGEYVTPEKMLMTLVDVNRLYLQLHVYEKDIAKLMVGQNVEFYNPNNPDTVYTARLSKIGKAVDPEKKTILCTADIQVAGKNDFVNDMYVECEVITSERSAKGIPEEAVETAGEVRRLYVLEKKDGDNYYFKPVTVQIGIQSGHYVELKSDVPQQQVLIKGVYSLPAGG
ncbi:MAG: efflux RND transporter periplasmic adaptor subunit [Petrimonas sp.]|nr:efflux RND transporter periplasmic adaptor subunit [Petrimonas sp.]